MYAERGHRQMLIQEKDVQRNETPYLFVNPESFLSDTEKEQLSEIELAIIAPGWLSIPPPDYGGTERVIHNIIRSKAASYIRKIHLYGHPHNAALEEQFPNLRTYSIDLGGKGYDDGLLRLRSSNHDARQELEKPHVIGAYEAIAANNAINIVHDHTILGRDYAHLLTSKNIPVLVTEHGPVMPPDLHAVPSHIYGSRLRIGMDPLLWSIAISNDQRSRNLTLNWWTDQTEEGEPVLSIPNGIDLGDFTYKPEKTAHPQYGEYGLYLGRIAPYKGLGNAMDASEKAKTPLVVAGDIEETPEGIAYYENEIVPRKRPDTFFVGNVGPHQREELMAEALYFTSLIEWKEPNGLTNGEAMASGTTVVYYPNGAVGEIVTPDVGFRVYSVEEAVNAINIIKSEPQSIKNSRVRAARERIERYYSTDSMGAGYGRTYLQAIHQARTL